MITAVFFIVLSHRWPRLVLWCTWPRTSASNMRICNPLLWLPAIKGMLTVQMWRHLPSQARPDLPQKNHVTVFHVMQTYLEPTLAALLLIYYVLLVWIKQSFLYELSVYVRLFVMYSKWSKSLFRLDWASNLDLFTYSKIVCLQRWLFFGDNCCHQAVVVSSTSAHTTAHVPVAHPPGPYQSIRERKMVAAGARGARSITETLDWICLSTSEGDSL